MTAKRTTKIPAASLITISDGTPVPTGVLDAHGVMLYRVKDRHPLGFDVSKASRCTSGKG